MHDPHETASKLKPRSWFRLRLRDLFFLLTIASMWIAWRVDRQQIIKSMTQLESPGWQTFQATGKPDSLGPGDIPTAWASATQDGSQEWMELGYSSWVKPHAVEIHESYNPGAVDKVTMFDKTGKEIVVWQGTDDPTKRKTPGIALIPVKQPFWTQKIKIYINSPKVAGWNEIDAVGLVDWKGKRFWAEEAKASSCYADAYGRLNVGVLGSNPAPPSIK